MANVKPERWIHPLYKKCYCYDRNGTVYTSVFSKRQSTTLAWNPKNKPDALRILEIRFNRALAELNGIKEAPSLISMATRFIEVVVNKQTQHTKLSYKQAFKTFIGDFNCDITDTDKIKEHIQKMVKKYEKKLSPATVNLRLTKLIAFFNFCVSEGVITSNPINPSYKLKEEKSEPLTYSIEELEQIRDYVESNFKNKRLAQYIQLLTYTGMRANECLTIETADIKEDHLIINGKGGYRRIFPYFIAPQVQEILFELRDSANKRRRNNIFDFSYHAGSVNFTKVNKILFNDTSRTLHTIRKAVSSIWKDLSMPVEDRCNLLGHDIAIETKIYNRTADMQNYKMRLNDFAQNLHTDKTHVLK